MHTLFRSMVLAVVVIAVALTGAMGENEDEEETPEFEEQKIVVTATRTPVEAGEVTASTTIVTQDDIEASGAKKIDDALRLVPGLDVRRSFGAVTMTSTVSMRGMGNEPGRTLVMIDGIPANKADTGNFQWNRIDPEVVERIEVVRGPTSALWGSHAMGGVINIITTDPTDEPEVTVHAEIGSLDTNETKLLARGTAGSMGYRITASLLNSGGYDPVPMNSEERTEFTTKRDAEEFILNARLSPDIGKKGRLWLDYSLFDDKRHEGERIQDPCGLFRQFDTQQFNLLYDQKVGSADLSLKLYDIEEDYFWNRERLRRGSYTRYEVEVERTERGGLLQGSHKVGSRGRLTAGFDFKHGEVDGADNYKEGADAGLRVINQGKQHIVGAFAQYERGLAGDRGRFVVGGRFDWADISDGRFVDETGFLPNGPLEDGGWPDADWNSFSPKAGLLYHASDKTDVRLNVGRAFRPPILDDLFRSGIFRGRYYRAKADLEPESVWTFEAGLEHHPSPDTTLRLTGYVSDADDFFYAILVDPDFDPRPLYEQRNVAEVKITGLEGDVEHQFSRTCGGFLNFTLNKSVITRFKRLSESDPDLTGKDLEFTPRWKANVGLRYHGDSGWRGQLTGRFVDDQFANPDNTARIDKYFVWDLTARRKVAGAWEVAVEVRNLFDKDFVEDDYFELVGDEWTSRTDPGDPTSPLLGDVALDPGRVISFVVRRRF